MLYNTKMKNFRGKHKDFASKILFYENLSLSL